MPPGRARVTADDLSLVIVLLTVAAAYIPFRYCAVTRSREARAIHTQRLLGAIYLGVIPLVVTLLVAPTSLAEVGLRLGKVVPGLLFVAGFSGVAVVGARLTAPKQAARGRYPQIVHPDGARWPARLVLANAATWAVYLLGYEILLRGVLLTSLARVMHPWPAIAVTTLAYAWAHLPKHPSETIGSLPLGLVFGGITLYTGSILPAFVAHTVMAVANDHFIRQHHLRRP